MHGELRQNIEIKVRVNLDADIMFRALDIGAKSHGTSTDVDTYFRVSHGRMKLRMSENKKAGTLIYYERADQETSRVSNYRLVPVEDGNALLATLSQALGVLIRVKKTRVLLMYGATRIHFDQVEGLGSFIELETVMGTQSMEAAHDEHLRLFTGLTLDSCEIVPLSYSDLLLNAK
ncbi:MAG TPA: class IV adenylate cyclase [Nitrolancea sp.]|nr:class IV adenylate cyclase [Nitrolancea sp.]